MTTGIDPKNSLVSSERKVWVAIPVFNAKDHLANLLDDLNRTFAKNNGEIHFHFNDDASPDPGVQKLLSSHPFLKCPHVSRARLDKNLGFVGNVNNMFQIRTPGWDFLILNTDVRFDRDFITPMKRLLSETEPVASITPLSNNATLASVFNWPLGGEITETLLGRINESLPSKPLYLDVFTGVGFCMYMTREAIDAIGGFSSEFGAGYGEETDWCRRAQKAGFRNILCLNAFVGHVGTQSFSSDFRDNRKKSAARKMDELHPEFHPLLTRELDENRLRLFRLQLLLAATCKTPEERALLLVLHVSPGSRFAGGTGNHVRNLSEKVSARGRIVIELYPDDRGYGVQLFHGGKSLTEERFQRSDLPRLLEVLENFTDTLHVHHLKNWSQEAVDHLFRFSRPKVISVHDFSFITSEVNLNHLELSPNRLAETFERTSLHRKWAATLLQKASIILCPSEDTRKWMELFFNGPSIIQKLQVLPHDLESILTVSQTQHRGVISKRKPTVAFVGSLYPHKGVVQIVEAVPLLKKAGFNVTFFGSIDRKYRKQAGEPIHGYESLEQLNALYATIQPDFVCFNSLTPETFCYTFYEALLLGANAVPVVSPLGNPARVVQEQELGIVMQDFSAEAIVKGCLEALSRQESLSARVQAWRKLELSGKKDHISRYLEALPHASAVTSAPASPESLLFTSQYNYRTPTLPVIEIQMRRVYALLDRIARKFPAFESLLRFGILMLKKLKNSPK